MAPAFYLESIQVMMPRREKTGNSLPEVRRWSWDSGKARWTRISRAEYQRINLHGENTAETCRGIPWCIQQTTTDQCMDILKLPRPEH